MKIAVYGITKNEKPLLETAIASAKEADVILFGDTGSTDGTVDLPNVHPIHVSPWRFDDARNAVLALLPKDVDVCVALDSDEVLAKGWREEIETQWKPNTTIMRYMYDWNSGVVFHQAKIHARSGYRWVSPCHETLTYYGPGDEVWAYTEKFLMYHYPDNTKPRSSYLPLLRMGYKENPHIPRNVLYYGREVFFAWLHTKEDKFREEATRALNEYLEMKGRFVYPAEVAYAYRILGKMNGDEEAFKKAIENAPTHRCPYVWYAAWLYSQRRFKDAERNLDKAIRIQDRTTDYMVDPHCWDGYPSHLMSWCWWHLGDKDKALTWGQLAIGFEPNNDYYKKCLEKFENETPPKA